MKSYTQILTISLLSFFFYFSLSAQVSIPADSLRLNTPYDCIYNHLFYLQSEQYNLQRSSLSFALAESPEKAQRNAAQLKQILDATGHYVYMSTVPEKNNFIDSLTGKAIYIPFPKTLPQIYLQKISDQWQYSEETNQAIDQLFKKTYPFGSHKLVEYFDSSQTSSFLGVALWQYLALLIFLVLGFILYKVISMIIHFIYGKIAKTKFRKVVSFDQDNKISNPLSVMVVLNLIRLFLPILQLNVKWSEYIIIGLNIAISIIVGLILIRLVDVLIHFLSKIADKTENKLDEQLMPMLQRLLKILVFFITTMYVLKLLHVNITALIAGVSIGGLALALAAQDTVKNLIGSLMIFLDSPFQIGDYVQVNGMEGTVVEVGFRSTKIRTSDSSIISFPNGSLSSSSMTNKGRRTHRLLNTTLTLSYNTKAKDIKRFIDGLKQIVLDHEKTDKESMYIYLTNLNSSSIDVLFRTNIITTAYDEELKIKEELLFSVIQLANELNISFAFPSQDIYLHQ